MGRRQILDSRVLQGPGDGGHAIAMGPLPGNVQEQHAHRFDSRRVVRRGAPPPSRAVGYVDVSGAATGSPATVGSRPLWSSWRPQSERRESPTSPGSALGRCLLDGPSWGLVGAAQTVVRMRPMSMLALPRAREWRICHPSGRRAGNRRLTPATKVAHHRTGDHSNSRLRRQGFAMRVQARRRCAQWVSRWPIRANCSQARWGRPRLGYRRRDGDRPCAGGRAPGSRCRRDYEAAMCSGQLRCLCAL